MRYIVKGVNGSMISEKFFATYQEAGMCSLKLKKEGWQNVTIRKEEGKKQILKSIDSLYRVQMYNALHRH